MDIWNPWHGCRKFSEGCLNCYMYRRDASVGRDSTVIEKTASFDLPVRKKRDGAYKLRSGETVFTCMTSDFFIEEADEWRRDAWRFIRERSDLSFYIITKRIDRFRVSLPEDWKDGYDNVTIGCTCENQRAADSRLPVVLDLPIKHVEVIHEPMLGSIDIDKYLASGRIEQVICGGESGQDARMCDYAWILFSREQCMKHSVPFHFKQTGANFRKDGKKYLIPRSLQLSQARKARIDTIGGKDNYSGGRYED